MRSRTGGPALIQCHQCAYIGPNWVTVSRTTLQSFYNWWHLPLQHPGMHCPLGVSIKDLFCCKTAVSKSSLLRVGKPRVTPPPPNGSQDWERRTLETSSALDHANFKTDSGIMHFKLAKSHRFENCFCQGVSSSFICIRFSFVTKLMYNLTWLLQEGLGWSDGSCMSREKRIFPMFQRPAGASSSKE